MLRDTTKKIIILLALLTTGIASIAQPKDNSPLSRIGFGEPANLNFTSSASMGGLGAAYRHLYQVNLQNPASLGYLEATALEPGFYAKRSTLQRGDFESTVWSGNIDYLSLSFPILNPINELLERRERDFGWGVNVSLTPVSRVGYFITSESDIDSIGAIGQTFQGSGGTYRFNVGNGWRYKDFSFGVNLGYLFGRTTYLSELEFSEIVGDYTHVSKTDISYRGLTWNMGAQYGLRLKPSEDKNRRFIVFGAHLGTGSSFNTLSDHVNYVYNITLQDSDTARYEVGVKGSGDLPASRQGTKSGSVATL